MGTVAFILIIPIVLLVCSSFLTNSLMTICVDKLGLSEVIFIRKTDLGQTYSSVYAGTTAVLFLVLWFLIMMWYGYSKAKKINPKKNVSGHDYENSTVNERTPEDRTILYTNLLFPMIWYLFWTAVMNFFNNSFRRISANYATLCHYRN